MATPQDPTRTGNASYWRPLRLLATGEWVVACDAATFFIRLTDPFGNDVTRASNDARNHAAKLANALNRSYCFTFAPVFDEAVSEPEP